MHKLCDHCESSQNNTFKCETFDAWFIDIGCIVLCPSFVKSEIARCKAQIAARAWLESTEWAKHYKRKDPVTYEDAISIALDQNLSVVVYETDEASVKGDFTWAIGAQMDIGESFWLDSKKTKQEAIQLCEAMGWRYEVER